MTGIGKEDQPLGGDVSLHIGIDIFHVIRRCRQTVEFGVMHQQIDIIGTVGFGFAMTCHKDNDKVRINCLFEKIRNGQFYIFQGCLFIF